MDRRSADCSGQRAGGTPLEDGAGLRKPFDSSIRDEVMRLADDVRDREHMQEVREHLEDLAPPRSD
jgi:hypothetical protein